MENTPEFWKFVKEYEEKNNLISFPTIKILWERKKNEPIEVNNKDEKKTSKKSKK
jgi:hypothetical protein